MSSTLLEVTRSAHEEVERLERLIVKDLQNEPASNKDRLFQSHRVRNMIETIRETTDKIVCVCGCFWFFILIYLEGYWSLLCWLSDQVFFMILYFRGVYVVG